MPAVTTSPCRTRSQGTLRGVVLLCCLISASAVAVLGADRTTGNGNRYAPYPEVPKVDQGMVWPEGQALPTFATPANTLDTIEVQSLTRDECITFSALQGLVNKTRPRIYLLDVRSDEGRDTWANTPTVRFQSTQLYERDRKFDLIAKYADELRGVVLYDPQPSPHYRNLASTVAGLRGALPVTRATYDRLQERGIELDILVDLTSLAMTSPIEIYEHLYEHYWSECTKRFLVSARPNDRGGDHHHTRDIAAACGAAVVWLDAREPAERDALRKFFGDMRAGNAVVLGWYTTERSGITTASEFGIGTLPADHYLNATVYSGTDHQIRVPRVPKKPVLDNKAYITIFISDGDNIQYTQRAMRRLWDRFASSRGQVPLNWTIAPGLVDIGPSLLNYYYTTATDNDCFVAGPSGMGYMMPCNTLNEPGAPVGVFLSDLHNMDGYARLTETYLQRAGLRVVTIWDDATPDQRASYEKHCRNLYGATVHNFKDVPSVRASVENDRLRFDKLVIPYTGTYEHLRRSINQALHEWDGATPLFLAYQVAIWNEMKPDKIVALRDDLNAAFPGKMEFVRADHYFNLYNEAHGLPWNIVMSPTISVRGSSETVSPALAADGTPTTIWTSDDGDDAWLEFDLGADYDICRYVIRHAGDGGMDRTLNTRGFTVQASVDGRQWTTVDDQHGNSSNVTDIEVSGVRARRLKFLIHDPGTDGRARVADVEIFGRTPQ